MMMQGFTGLAMQNAQLLEQNQDLKNQLAEIQKQFNIIYQELMDRKREEQLIEELKKRKRSEKKEKVNQSPWKFMRF